MVVWSNQLCLKVFGRGDRQKDRQSSEVGSLGERLREVNLSFRRKRGKTSNLDGSGHKGLADFRESSLASLPIFNHCGMVVSLC